MRGVAYIACAALLLTQHCLRSVACSLLAQHCFRSTACAALLAQDGFLRSMASCAAWLPRAWLTTQRGLRSVACVAWLALRGLCSVACAAWYAHRGLRGLRGLLANDLVWWALCPLCWALCPLCWNNGGIYAEGARCAAVVCTSVRRRNANKQARRLLRLSSICRVPVTIVVLPYQPTDVRAKVCALHC